MKFDRVFVLFFFATAFLPVAVFAMGAAESGEVLQIDAKFYKQHIFDYAKESSFQAKNELPVVIDFYADWCGPCRMLAPIMDELAKEYRGRVLFLKVDAEVEKELAGVHGVYSYPTLYFLPPESGENGILRASGFLDKGQLVEIIEDKLLISEKEADEASEGSMENEESE